MRIAVQRLQGRIQGLKGMPSPKICDNFLPLTFHCDCVARQTLSFNIRPIRLQSQSCLPAPSDLPTPLALPQF